MIFDVALITREAEQDMCVLNSDTKSFKLPAWGWAESPWQPNEPKVFFSEAQINAKTTRPSVWCFCRSCHRVATTGESSAEEAQLTWTRPLNWHGNHRNGGLCCWQSEPKHHIAGIHSGEGFGSITDQTVWKKKIPNAQIAAPGAADPGLPNPAPFRKPYKRTRCIKITTSALCLFKEQHFKSALNLQTT